MSNVIDIRELQPNEVDRVDGGLIILALFAAPAVIEFAAGVLIGGAAVGAGIYLAERD